jgi:membrane-associated phospholipid phosphatase
MKKQSALVCVWLVSWLFLGLGFRPLQAVPIETETAAPTHHFNGKYLGKLGIDLGKTLISPIHWKGKDLLLFGGAIAATGIVISAMDSDIRDYVHDHQTTSKHNLSLQVTHLGEAPFLLGLSAILYGAGEAFGSDSLRATGLLSIESYAIAGVIVTGMKIVVGRYRPSSGKGPWEFSPFSLKNTNHSFPSGHSIEAFAVASVIAGESDSIWVGAASYGIASLVALSRITNNEHWFSDVFFGSLLGYFVGKEVLYLDRPGDGHKPTLSVGPGPGGLSLSLRF